MSVDEDEDVRVERERVFLGDIDGDGVIMDCLFKMYKGLLVSFIKFVV